MTIDDLYRDYCSKCVRHYAEARRTSDTGALHDFRVTVRRLKLLAGLLGDSGARIWPAQRRRQINRVFRSAGGLRDMQTQIRLCQYWGRRMRTRFLSFQTMLTQTERDYRDRFEHRAAAIPLDILLSVTPDIDQKLRQADMEVVRRLVQRRTATIPELLVWSENPDPEAIHPLRIRIKKMKYLLDVSHQLLEATVESADLREQLSRLQDRFGFWHDLQIQRNHAKMFLKTPGLTSIQTGRIEALRDIIWKSQERVLLGRFSIPREFL